MTDFLTTGGRTDGHGRWLVDDLCDDVLTDEWLWTTIGRRLDDNFRTYHCSNLLKLSSLALTAPAIYRTTIGSLTRAMSGSDSMGSAGGQTQNTLLQEEIDRKAALKKLEVSRTGGPKIKRPPTMPPMMPADHKDPADDNVQTPNFSEEEDEGFEKVETQTDLDMATDTKLGSKLGVDIEKSDSEEEDDAMEGEDEPMDDKTSEGTPASISSSANERTEDKLMGILGSAFATSIRGSEDKRMTDTNSLRDTSVNRTPGVTLITITLKEKNFMRMGQMVGTIHRMEGVTLRAQLFNPDDPTALDLILDIDNGLMGKLLGMALTADMAKAIMPKLAGSARTRSSE